jgi:hypothetical protein
MAEQRFPPQLVKAFDEGMFMRIRAGTAPHRFIGIWAVVVGGRVFVRSWSFKRRSWWRTFLDEPIGVVEVGGRQIAVTASQTTSERLRDAIDRAYLAKYHTKGWIKYARDLGSAESRDTTTELRPLPRSADRTLAPAGTPRARTPRTGSRYPRRTAS